MEPDQPSAACCSCGKPIPSLPEADPYCFDCRYHGDLPPEKIEADWRKKDVPVETFEAPIFETPSEGKIIAILGESGCSNPEQAFDEITDLIDEVAMKNAAKILFDIFQRLPGGRRGQELKAALLGAAGGESMAKLANSHNVPRQTWLRSIQRLQKRLFGTKNG